MGGRPMVGRKGSAYLIDVGVDGEGYAMFMRSCLQVLLVCVSTPTLQITSGIPDSSIHSCLNGRRTSMSNKQ